MYIMKEQEQTIVEVRLTSNSYDPSGETESIIIDGDKQHLFNEHTLCKRAPHGHLFIIKDSRGYTCRRSGKEGVGVSLTSFLFGRLNMKRINIEDTEDYSITAFKQGSGRFSQIDLYRDPTNGKITCSMYVEQAALAEKNRRQEVEDTAIRKHNRLSKKTVKSLSKDEAKFLGLDYEAIHEDIKADDKTANVPTLDEATGMETIELSELGKKNPTQLDHIIARRLSAETELSDLKASNSAVKDFPKGATCKCCWCASKFLKPMTHAVFCSSRDKPKEGMAGQANCRELYNNRVSTLTETITRLKEREYQLTGISHTSARSEEASRKALYLYSVAYIGKDFYCKASDEKINTLYEEYLIVDLEKKPHKVKTNGQLRQMILAEDNGITRDMLDAMSYSDVREYYANDEEDDWDEEEEDAAWDEEDEEDAWDEGGHDEDEIGHMLTGKRKINPASSSDFEFESDLEPMDRMEIISALIKCNINGFEEEILAFAPDSYIVALYTLTVCEETPSALKYHNMKVMVKELGVTLITDPTYKKLEILLYEVFDAWVKKIRFALHKRKVTKGGVFKTIKDIDFTVEQILMLVTSNSDTENFMCLKGIEFSLFEVRKLINMD